MDTIQAIIFKLRKQALETGINVGTPAAGIDAIEYGNGFQHTSVLTLNQDAAITSGDNVSLADGSLIYTLPVGALVVNSAYMNLLMTNAEHDTETPDVGLGTTIAAGGVLVLGGTPAFENIMTGQTITIGLETPIQAAVPLSIPASNSHLVHLNLAVAWADTAGSALDIDLTGTVVLNWSFFA